MKKRFDFDGFAEDVSLGFQAGSGNWTDAGDNFPVAALADATSGGGAVSNAPAAVSIPTLADWLTNGFWQYEGTIAHHWASQTISYNINGLNSAEKFLAQSALEAWHEVANVTFVQTTGNANITFVDTGNMTAVTSANWTNSGLMTSATVDISSNWITNDGGAMDGKTGIDSYGYQTYIHEIGHALGLGHQGPYNGSANYSTDAIYGDDTWQYSVMSYFSENNYSGSSYRYVVTPQMADIYAVDEIYGAASTRTGNTTYGFHSNAGSIYDFTQYGQAPALTIYDSGGNDTLDCSGYSAAQTIDLHPGAFSSVGGLVHNIAISTTTVIENGIGGSGNDTLIANDLGCTLSGGGGNDTLIGGAGNDTLIGGPGVDTMTGGGGADIFGIATGDSSAAKPDLITDFIHGTDHIDLSAFDAIAATPALDQFYFIGTAALTGAAGVLDYHYNSSLNLTVLQGDTNGDDVADFVLDLTGNIPVSLGDLIGASGQPPKADLTEYIAVNKTAVTAGSSLTVDAYDMNIGNAVAGASTAGIYLSTDPTISTSDTLLTTIATTGTLATIGQPGYYDHQQITVTLPGNLAPGIYYIGGIADYNNQLSEGDETNNTYDVVAVTVAAPDLTEYVAVNKTSVGVGGSITIDAYDMNLGNAVSPGSTAQLYLSTDPTITTSDTVLATLTTMGSLATVSQLGYLDHQTVTVNLPGNLAPGTYYIGGIADYNNQVSEGNEGNNTYDVVSITVTPPPQPDLTEYVAVNTSSVSAGGSIVIDAYDMNLGNAVSPGSTAQLYLSTDANITTSDMVLATLTTIGPLATVSQPGYYDHQTATVNLPGNLAPGTYYIGGIADYNGHVSESNETNNTYNLASITVTAPAQTAASQPDLSEYVAVDKTSVDAGGSVTIDAYDMNLGNAISGGSTAQIYLSTDANITTSDTVLATLTTTGPLATVSQPGYYDHQTATVNLPGNLAPGTYYIGGIADYNGHITESNETNNTYNVVQITVPPSQAPAAGNLVAPAGNDTFVFNANLGAGSSTTQETFEFNGVAAAAAGHQLASLFNTAAAETQYLQEMVAGDHNAVAYFANLEGSSPANVQVIQTAHGFIIH